MEYQIFAEIEGRDAPIFEPVAASSDEQAREAALMLIKSRSDISEVVIFRGETILAVLDRSAS